MKKIKKIKKIAALLIIAVLTATAFVGCAGCSGKGLAYSGLALSDGTAGADYSQSIASATGSDSITYAVKTGSNLPGGLELKDGKIEGAPLAAVKDAAFTIVASAEGFDDAEAQFTLSIQMSYSSFGLTTGRVGDAYNASVATAGGASAISYALKTNNLPLGLTLSSAGVISGTPTEEVSQRSFTVVASATGVDSVEIQFLITVVGENVEIPEIQYQTSQLTDGRVGVAYSKSIATATTNVGSPAIEYSIKSGSLPGGLTLSKQGLISGTPATAVSNRNITVVASANGYQSAEADFSISVVQLNQAIFEAEWVDFSGKLGVGVSGTVQGTGMIVSPNDIGGVALSNSMATGWCYGANIYFDFYINSDRDVDDAVLYMRLGNDFETVSGFSSDAFQLRIGTALDNQSVIKWECAPFSIPAQQPLNDYLITGSLPIKQGINVFSWEVLDNDLARLVQGTFECFGPVVDYVRIDSTAALSWGTDPISGTVYPKTGNGK